MVQERIVCANALFEKFADVVRSCKYGDRLQERRHGPDKLPDPAMPVTMLASP